MINYFIQLRRYLVQFSKVLPSRTPPEAGAGRDFVSLSPVREWQGLGGGRVMVTTTMMMDLDLDLDLEQVARQDQRYRARTSPPAEAWGSSRPNKKKKKCNREARSPCFYKARLVTNVKKSLLLLSAT